jgi:hypothetical protein
VWNCRVGTDNGVGTKTVKGNRRASGRHLRRGVIRATARATFRGSVYLGFMRLHASPPCFSGIVILSFSVPRLARFEPFARRHGVQGPGDFATLEARGGEDESGTGELRRSSKRPDAGAAGQFQEGGDGALTSLPRASATSKDGSSSDWPYLDFAGARNTEMWESSLLLAAGQTAASKKSRSPHWTGITLELVQSRSAGHGAVSFGRGTGFQSSFR